MRPKAGYVGMAVLLIVLAVVLVLVARAWTEIAPSAIEVSGTDARPIDDHGQTDAAAEVRSGRLPDLDDAREKTGSHAADVEQALGSQE